MPSIKIDPRYWETVKKDYADWRFAWVREAGQNSLDAGASRIDVFVEPEYSLDGVNRIRVHWRDNGVGMSQDVLENKYMALGGSFKTTSNTGGFGIAKSILAFAQYSYVIATGNLFLKGCGCDYEISPREEYVDGTNLSVVISDTSVEDMCAKIRYWIQWTTTKCRIFLNGEQVKTCKLPSKPRQELDWARIYVHRKNDNVFYKTRVRINGQFMFHMWNDVERHITIDIVGVNSQDYFTANRDGLNWRYTDKLTQILAQIFQDPKKITSTDVDDIKLWTGRLGRVSLVNKREVSPKVAALSSVLHENAPAAPTRIPLANTLRTIMDVNSLTTESVDFALNGYDIVVVNNLSKEIPAKWLPGAMSTHAKNLLNKWVEVLKFAAPICYPDMSCDIIVGWIFHETHRAEYRYMNEFGHMVLLNPVSIVNNKFVQHWNGTSTHFYKLVATAVHELTHIEHPNHSEAYANALTANLAKIMAHYPQLELIRRA